MRARKGGPRAMGAATDGDRDGNGNGNGKQSKLFSELIYACYNLC